MLNNLPPLAPFRPRLLQDLRGYGGDKLARDMGAGATVGIVALPLAMPFAIASGLKPEAGLWTAIIAGFIISALGGTSVQIGGPAGAFIVIVYGIVERYGVANLLIATASAGVLLFLMGLFRLGTLVRYVPVSVVIGLHQRHRGADRAVADARLAGPGHRQDARRLLRPDRHHLPATSAASTPTPSAWERLCVVGLFIWPRLWAVDSQFRRQLDRLETVSALKATSRLPAPVVALVSLSLLAWALQLPVETIGSRFGGIPQSVPAFALPDFSWDTVRLLVTPTLTIALLGAIESLLCARVADQLSETPKHDPNQELMAQGIANLVVPFFGGMPATGTIARTVTNIRSGAASPVAGIVHALTLAAVVLIAAPLAQHIPLAVLAGVLLFVAWNMGEWREFGRLKHFSNHYRLMMVSTFLVTIIFDLTVAVELGLVMACFLFVRRQSDIFRADLLARNTHQLTYRLFGSLFFGAVAKIDAIVADIEGGPAGVNLMLDASQLISLDTTGLDALEQLLKVVEKRGGHMGIVGLNPQPKSLIERSGFRQHLHTCD